MAHPAREHVREEQLTGFKYFDRLQPLFARPGAAGAWLSVLLMLQVVPYFMTGFESVVKCAEEASPVFRPRHYIRAIVLAIVVGILTIFIK